MFKFNFSIKSLAAVFMMSAAVAASSCKEDEETPEAPYLEVEEAEVFFNKWEPATRELAVRSNVRFTATSDEPWCVATVREAEESNLLIAVEGNDGSTVRTARITLAGAGVQPVVLEVGQATDAPYINIPEAQQWILLGQSDAYSSKRTVRSNRPVTITSDQAWCTVTMLDYDANYPTTREYQLEVTKNEDMLHARDATITISYPALDPVHIRVTQPANYMGSAATWQEAANQRIEQYRKNDMRIKVTQSGVPLSGAGVAVDMTEHEFLFGCYADHYVWDAASHYDLTTAKREAYLNQWVDLFNYATFPFYWEFEPVEGQSLNPLKAQMVQWYNEHGVHHIKGHPLVYSYMPDWAKALSREDLYHLVLQRVEGHTSYFAGTNAFIGYWDVVNEATDASPISQYGGIVNFTKECLKAARRGNPQAKLLMNEMDASDGYVNLLRKMVDDAGQPLYDAIGIQSHMHNGARNAQTAWRTCEMMARFGKPIHFTETTITSSRQMGGTTNPAEEELQKNEVIDWYTLTFSHPSVEAISWWNLSDYAAWQGAAAGLLRSDMSPKPAYTALKKLIKEDWATHETLPTNANGEVQLRAFRGKYRITVTPPGGGAPTVKDVVVGKGENVVEVSL